MHQHHPSRWGVALTFALVMLLAGCGVPGVVAGGHALAQPAPTPTALPLPPLRLPQDEAPHTNLTEWWYYTGHLHGTDSGGHTHTYGFELTFFQVIRSGFPPIYIGHYAISDITRGQFHFDQRELAEPNAVLPNGTTTTGFNLHINDWSMQGVNGHDALAATMTDFAINLALTATKAPALHNGNGLIPYGVLGYSYYYSRTSMNVTGTVQDHGVTVPVTGLAWMDHQWGNFISTAGSGWDWFSVQLQNGTDFMIYLFRDSNGNIISALGTREDQNGVTTQIDSAQIHEQVLNHWQSTVTKIVYPSGWTLGLPGATLTVSPLLLDQELVTTNTTGNTYWEGACQVTGTLDNQAVSGQGYTELTGYQATH